MVLENIVKGLEVRYFVFWGALIKNMLCL